MKNERGEVVIGVLVVTMVVMMVFGRFFMHGGHYSHGRHCTGNGNEQIRNSVGDPRQMHDGAVEKDPVLAANGKK